MRHFFLDFRFLRGLWAASIAASTCSLGIFDSAFASSSNFRHPWGFFAIESILEKSAGQGAVGETLARNIPHGQLESARVVHSAFVESEHLLADVAIEVERGDGDIGATETPLEQAPKVLHAVRVNRPVDILAGMIDGRMNVRAAKAAVVAGFIGIDGRTDTDLAANVQHHRAAVSLATHNGCPNATRLIVRSALQDAMHRSLANRAASTNDAPAFGFVHVSRQTTDECGIGFAWSLEFIQPANFHRFANTVQHEPSRLLSNADRAGEFVAADSILAIGDCPHGNEPLIQTEWAGLKNRPDARRELFAAFFAPHDVAGGNLADALAVAMGAGDFAGRPLDVPHVGFGHAGIGEVADGFHESFRGVHSAFLLRCGLAIPLGTTDRASKNQNFRTPVAVHRNANKLANNFSQSRRVIIRSAKLHLAASLNVPPLVGDSAIGREAVCVIGVAFHLFARPNFSAERKVVFLCRVLLQVPFRASVGKNMDANPAMLDEIALHCAGAKLVDFDADAGTNRRRRSESTFAPFSASGQVLEIFPSLRHFDALDRFAQHFDVVLTTLRGSRNSLHRREFCGVHCRSPCRTHFRHYIYNTPLTVSQVHFEDCYKWCAKYVIAIVCPRIWVCEFADRGMDLKVYRFFSDLVRRMCEEITKSLGFTSAFDGAGNYYGRAYRPQ